MADDAEDVVGGDDGFGGGDDVEEEGAAADLVEDFGAFAFEPRAFAGGHDGDGEVWCVHTAIWSHVRYQPYISDSAKISEVDAPNNNEICRPFSLQQTRTSNGITLT